MTAPKAMPAVGAAWRCAATAQKLRRIVRVYVAKEQANDCGSLLSKTAYDVGDGGLWVSEL